MGLPSKSQLLASSISAIGTTVSCGLQTNILRVRLVDDNVSVSTSRDVVLLAVNGMVRRLGLHLRAYALTEVQ